MNDRASAVGEVAERAFLAGLGGGCSAPVAAHGRLDGDTLALIGRVISPDGSITVDVSSHAHCLDEESAHATGASLANAALAKGAGEIVGALR